MENRWSRSPSKGLSARLRFPEPLGLLDDLLLARKLVEHLCQRLTADQMGLTRLRLEAETPAAKSTSAI